MAPEQPPVAGGVVAGAVAPRPVQAGQ